jgi:hypothetical protein
LFQAEQFSNDTAIILLLKHGQEWHRAQLQSILDKEAKIVDKAREVSRRALTKIITETIVATEV